ncbi:Hsp20/alpha crystallin family protein [Streptomyces sp. NPDC020096]
MRQRATRLAERQLPSWRDPVAEFDELFERIGQLLETAATSGPQAERMAWAPLAELSETDDAYVVEVELPGVKREDLDVEMNERELVISGELKETERKGVLRRSTRRTGHFEYRAVLPGEVKTEEVDATLADGVLKVTIPKAEAMKPRHIEVKSQSKR